MKGIELAELFYFDVIKPLITKKYPELRYSAASLGPGSDILGYDDEMSQDHDWGLKFYIFLNDDKIADELDLLFRNELPLEFHGYSTHWGEADDKGVQLNDKGELGNINHRIIISSLSKHLKSILNINISDINEIQNLSLTQWLSFPEQSLLEFTSGKVYFDNCGDLTSARKLLNYYPEEIWIFAILGEWNLIAEEQVFISRTGDREDDLGSRIITSSLVRRIMRLAIHLDRKYIPYSKWLGTAFKDSSVYDKINTHLMSALNSNHWTSRRASRLEDEI